MHSIEAEIFYRTIKDSNRFSLKFSTLYHEKQRYPKSRFFKIPEKGTAEEDLNGTVGLRTIERWCKSFRETGSVDPRKVMVWLAICSQWISPLVIFDDGTLDHVRYIGKVLPVALQYGNKVFGNQWTFQQDGGRPHIHAKKQQWCAENFPVFINKDRWPADSPNLNPLDYSIWDEVASRINWKKITSKKTLIYELKRAVHRIRSQVVFESCSSWTFRLSRLSTNNGECISLERGTVW